MLFLRTPSPRWILAGGFVAAVIVLATRYDRLAIVPALFAGVALAALAIRIRERDVAMAFATGIGTLLGGLLALLFALDDGPRSRWPFSADPRLLGMAFLFGALIFAVVRQAAIDLRFKPIERRPLPEQIELPTGHPPSREIALRK